MEIQNVVEINEEDLKLMEFHIIQLQNSETFLRTRINQLNAEIERMNITEDRIYKRGHRDGVTCACLCMLIIMVIAAFVYNFWGGK